MGSGRVLPWSEALETAREVSRRLTPHVERLKCAGSVRRRRPYVSDLEFVAEPRMVQVDLLGGMGPDLDALKAELLGWSEWVKGGDRYWQVTNVLGVEGLQLDLFLVHPPAEWGSVLAIRTGPWQLGRHAVTLLARAGTPHVEGCVQGHPTPTEEDFFALAGLECVPAAQRDDYAADLGIMGTQP